ncbi:LysR substrate-binding domain-containing protein [Phaeovulum sp.]|uniref:LysR substrate-binding domain-containing protein n=1 Tax=Phaeovulum sp. TaxID=2934796 RepID=UPI0035620925
MLTLRQIEVIRAIMLAGTVKGAADLLGVSAPGISRVMKHTEGQLGLRLFSRNHGRFVPTTEAHGIFAQINEVFTKVENLQFSIDALKKGVGGVFSFASAPSISQHILPRAVKRLRQKFPALRMNINILKIEETIDYLLLKKGEVVAMSFKIDHPGLVSYPLAAGRLVALVPEGHALADKRVVSLAELAAEPLIGIDPADPYGQILAAPFGEHGLAYDLAIQARFGQTVASLVAANLGVAVLDEFSMAAAATPGVAVRAIAEPTSFKTYGVFNAEVSRSIFADELIEFIRQEMRAAVAARGRG